MTPLQRCERKAAKQHWVLSRDQGLASGLSRRVIERLLSSGRWKKVLPGVYLVNQAPYTKKARVMAAVLWGGPGAVASHRTAGWLHDLLHGSTDPVEIALPHRRNSNHGVRVHVFPSLAEEPRVYVDNIPVTRISRTILDMCAVLSAGASSDLVADGIRRNKSSIPALGRILDVGGGPGKGGTKCLRKILTERFASGINDSDAEDIFQSLAERRSYRFVHHHVVSDGSFFGELDFADLQAMVDIEIDGGKDHDDPVAQQNDKERDAELSARGWLVLRFTYWDLIRRPDWVFLKIQRVLARRGSQLSLDEHRFGVGS